MPQARDSTRRPRSVEPPRAAVDENRLLAVLQSDETRRIVTEAELTVLQYGDVLLEPNERVRHLWFPRTALVALVIPTREGGTTGVATVGCDGLVGYEALIGDGCAVSRCTVQFAGHALRLPVEAMLAMFHGRPALRQLVLNYIVALHAEVMQAAACHALHPSAARLAQVLLQVQDRSAGRAIIPLTHEDLAGLLSAQRTTITHIARALQQAGLIDYRRGRISVLDRPGLEARACECYGVIRTIRSRLLPAVRQ